MAKIPKKAPIGFGRNPDPNGAGDGYRWNSGDVEEPAEEEKPLPPPRQPKAKPNFIGDIEAQEILTAYSLFPLTPLSTLEYQLLQVIAGLEQELEKYQPEL